MPRTRRRSPVRPSRPPPRVRRRRLFSRRSAIRPRRPPPPLIGRRPGSRPRAVIRRSQTSPTSRRTPAIRRSPISHRSPVGSRSPISYRRSSRRGPAAAPIAILRTTVPRLGLLGPVLAAARTGTFGAGLTSGAAIRRPRFFLPTTLSARPLGRDRIWLGLCRPSPAQIREPFVVGVVAGAASALVPLTPVIAAAGSPWIRDSLGNRGPAAPGRSLPGCPLIGVAVLVRRPPTVVLPGLCTTVVRWPGFVGGGIGGPLVLLCLRPS
jgi:hypothetical protein